MWDIGQCDCKVVIDDNSGEMTGKFISMEYKGNGIFHCQECNKEANLSEDVYFLRLLFLKDEEGHMDIQILKLTQEIEGLKEDILDEIYDYMDYVIENHKEGIFDWELYRRWSKYSYEDYGEDLDIRLFKETKVIGLTAPIGGVEEAGNLREPHELEHAGSNPAAVIKR